MDIWQGISLTIVLLLAFWGCASLARCAVWRLLRPKTPRMHAVLTLSGHVEDAEQQVRYAKEWASSWHLPLVVTDEGMDDESRRIVTMLLCDKDRYISSDTNRANDSCVETEMRV